MPRKKATDRVGPVKTRSRAGCSECRASRVRCDTKKPICTRCKERGLECSTHLVLKWEAEFASRGLAFGRAGVWSKSRSPGQSQASIPPSLRYEEQEWCPTPEVRSWGFVNSELDSFERPFEVNVEFDETISLGRNGDLSQNNMLVVGAGRRKVELTKSVSLFPYLAESGNGYLFEYYLKEVCPRTIATTRAQSPFASTIVPFCLTASPTLFNAIKALGACYWARSNASNSIVALRLKSEAVKGLRRRLSAPGPSNYYQDPELLVIMMMLCLYELVDHCDERWTIHLKGAKELIRLRRQHDLLPSPSTNPVTALAEHFFAFQDIMGRTACGEKALFGADYWQEDDHRIDPWMACSPEFVSILSSITELSQTRRQLASDSAQTAFGLRTASLRRQLEELVQDGDDDDVNLQTTAELKRLAAILYLHCALYSASPSTTLVSSYVRRILKLVYDLLDSGSPVSLTWPVFVAAVELDPLNDEIWTDSTSSAVYGRPLVLRALAAMSESSVLSVARTRVVIVKVWQARDNDMLKGSSRDVQDDPTKSNDWETYVAPVSAAMSLA